MMVISRKLFDKLCHPEKKPKRKLKPEDLVARDSFTGETMTLQPIDNSICKSNNSTHKPSNSQK